MDITMEQIEEQIDNTTKAANQYSKGEIEKNQLVESVDALRDIVKAGIKAGLYCNEKRIRQKFSKLEKALNSLL